MAVPFSINFGSSGLGEVDIGVPNADTYTVETRLLLPSVNAGNGASAVVTVIQVNSTVLYTSDAGNKGATISVPCLAGDVIKIITSSAQANDNAINAVRLNASISQGTI
jgi:hypothetical protein